MEAGVGAVVAAFSAGEAVARLGSASVNTSAGDAILLRLILVGGAGLAAVVVSSFLLLGFGNRISRELTVLRGAARAGRRTAAQRGQPTAGGRRGGRGG